ncbi:hypothetical protein [Arthrobacter sp. SAFR-014]|uniref:hypothetical protein n=1 Tax=unclassified Arthrobacter TaxID=235627 RepID=UPI003F7BB0D4
MKNCLALVVVLIFVAIGSTSCGSGGSSESSAPPTTAVSPTPTVETSTPQQLAGVVSEHNANVAQIKLDTDCDLYEYVADGNPKAFTENVQALTCSMGKQTHSIRAQILAAELSELSPYPADMQSLVEDTVAKAENLAAIMVNDACESMSSVTEECRAARLSYKLAAPQLEAILAKWKPYGA